MARPKKNEQDKVKTKYIHAIHLKLDDETMKAVKEIAEEEERQFGTVARRLVQAAVKNRKPDA